MSELINTLRSAKSVFDMVLARASELPDEPVAVALLQAVDTDAPLAAKQAALDLFIEYWIVGLIIKDHGDIPSLESLSALPSLYLKLEDAHREWSVNVQVYMDEIGTLNYNRKETECLQ